MPKRRRGVLALTGLLAIAACSSSESDTSGSVENRTLSKARGVPAASAVEKDNTVVAAGRWGVVTAPDYADRRTTFAIRATAIQRGKAGDLKNVRIVNNAAGDADPTSGVPYYISFDYTVLVGPFPSSPIQQLSATDREVGGNDPAVTTLSVPDDVKKCDPPGDYSPTPQGHGFETRGCVVAVATAGVRPAFLVFYDFKGSKFVRFPIPAR